MKRKLLFAAIMIASALGANLYAQISPDKVYTIANNNDANMFMQDNGGQSVALGNKNDNSYWKFVPTGNADCYYIQNAVTGKYIQGYTATEQEVGTGDTGVEYYVKADASGDLTGKFRFAVTSLEKHDFSEGTLGLNWKNNNTVQSFASVAGGNPRSAWIVTEVTMTFLPGKTYTIANNNDANMFIQEHDATGGSVVEVGGMSNRAYWLFEATGNADCYYIKNALTGKYLQGYNAEHDEISSGDSPVEYFIKADAEGNLTGKFRFAVTSLEKHDFSDGTLGLNWEGAADWEGDYDCLQAFASVAGGNPRSAWIVTEAAMPEEPEVFTFDANKKYSIVNFQDNAYFMKDGRTGRVLVETGLTSNALWQFEASGTDNCYYVRNALTGKYMQSTNSNEQPVLTADTPLEIMVVNDPAKGFDVFGFASTDQDDLTFQDDRTFGANWNAEGYAQGYAVTLGGRVRSFWKVAEVPTVDFADNVDNTAAITAGVGAEKNAVVTRSLAKDMWNTLVVPHAMNPQAITRNFGEGAKVAALTREADGELEFSTVAEIVAGKPYLVKPTIDVVNIITLHTTVSAEQNIDGGDSYKFVGLYAPATIGTDDYFMAANNTLMKNGAGGQMKAFRAYFQATSSQVKALVGFSVDETETGIIAPDGTVYEDTRIFNLAGQQVNMNKTRKGIFIINGKKFIK